MDALHLIGQEEMPKLNQLLSEHSPRTFVIENWIITRLRWQKRHPGKHPFYICCPNGRIQDGLVAFGKTGNRVYYLTIFFFHDDLNPMTRALLGTKKIDWSEKMVCGVPTGKEKWLTGILNTLGYAVHHDTPTHVYKLAKEIPPSFEIKCHDGVYIAPLKQADVPRINNLWQHNFEGSDQLLAECIDLNRGIGVYSQFDHYLLAWVIECEYSDVAILWTDWKYRKRGYGKLLVQIICKMIAEDGEDSLSFIVPGNIASENMSKGLGFTNVSSYNWVEYDDKKKLHNVKCNSQSML